MDYKCKIFVAVTEQFMGISIFIDTHVYNFKSYLQKEKEVCLANREYITGHR